MIERRQHFDPMPPVQFVPVAGNCKLVQRNGFAHLALLALDFTEIDRDGDCVLMLAPEGFTVVGQ